MMRRNSSGPTTSAHDLPPKKQHNNYQIEGVFQEIDSRDKLATGTEKRTSPDEPRTESLRTRVKDEKRIQDDREEEKESFYFLKGPEIIRQAERKGRTVIQVASTDPVHRYSSSSSSSSCSFKNFTRGSVDLRKCWRAWLLLPLLCQYKIACSLNASCA